MPSLIQLLQQAQQELACPTCGRSFHLSEIRPRNHAKKAIMLQAVCSNNHFPIVLVFIPQQPLTEVIKPITKREVNNLSQALQGFDGEFNKIW